MWCSPAPNTKGAPRQLVHDEAAQDLRQRHHQPAGDGDRRGAAHQRPRRVDDGQRVLRHQEQLVDSRLRLLQRGARLRVQQDVPLLGQRLVAARHRRRHVDGALAARAVVRHKDERLGRVLQHQRHLRVVHPRGVDAGGDADGHQEVDVGQRVDQPVAVDEVLRREGPVLAGERVEQVQAVGAGAEVDARALQAQGGVPVAVAHHHAAGRRGERVLHHAGREPDEVAVRDERAGPPQQVERAPVVEADAGAAQHLQRAEVQPLKLRLGQHGELRG